MLKFITKEKKPLKVYATALVHWVQDHRCDVRLRLYGMIYLPSASAMDVKLQSRPPADEWRKTGPSIRGTGEGPAWEVFLVKSWWDVLVRMRHAIGPGENAFPTWSPPLWLSPGLEVDSKSLSQSIRFIDLVIMLTASQLKSTSSR